MGDKLCFPNYKNGSIINLMASIQNAYGKRKSNYGELSSLRASEIKKFDNIVLLVVDGLGYNYILKQGKKSYIKKNLRNEITTVFPPTTPAAISSFLNGTPPLKHGIIGYFYYVPEVGAMINSIKGIYRTGGNLGRKYNFKKIYDITPFGDRLNIESYIINSKNTINSDFTVFQSGKTNRVGYNDINDCFKKTEELIKAKGCKKYFYLHLPHHDSLSHDYGLKSKKVLNFYDKLDSSLENFMKKLKGTNTIVIVCADHGMVDVPKKNMILMKDYPEIQKTLVMPMGGQSRYSNCYVQDKKKFKKLVKKEIGSKVDIFAREKALKLYGPGKATNKIKMRIGDYLLVAKKNYGIYDLMNEQSYETYDYNTCDHGGLSKDEMQVPLVVLKSK